MLVSAPILAVALVVLLQKGRLLTAVRRTNGEIRIVLADRLI